MNRIFRVARVAFVGVLVAGAVAVAAQPAHATNQQGTRCVDEDGILRDPGWTIHLYNPERFVTCTDNGAWQVTYL